jgi:hypothetical protein
MTWEQFTKANSVLGFVSTVVTIAGIIWGILVAGHQLCQRIAKDQLGSICLNEDLMGYFVTKVSLIWSLFPILMPKPHPPSLLSVSGLIEAGDAGVFSSSIFDWMTARYSRVSWTPFYEAFLREYVWACERPGTTDFEIIESLNIGKDHGHMKYLKKARDAVLRIKRKAEGKSNNAVSRKLYRNTVRLLPDASICFDNDPS